MSEADIYEPVGECNYDGCIYNLVCSLTCGDEKCDEGLVAVYSESGMLCN